MAKKRTFVLLMIFWLCQMVPLQAATSSEYQQVLDQLSNAIEAFRRLPRPTGLPDDLTIRRDPLRSLVNPEGQLVNPSGLYEGLALQGIIQSQGFNRALIEDKLFSEGDKIGPYTILEIRPDGVFAQLGNERHFIPLYKESQESKPQKE